jgi:hypothetical protein
MVGNGMMARSGCWDVGCGDDPGVLGSRTISMSHIHGENVDREDLVSAFRVLFDPRCGDGI